MIKLIDQFNRELNYLRVAITDRCNLRCLYCLPDKNVIFKKTNEILTDDQIVQIIKIFLSLGVNKVRYTGGEPFVRKNFISIIEKVRNIDKNHSTHITTNGVLLKNYIPTLKKLGLNSVNISLDSLKPEIYKKITGFNKLNDVLDSIYLSLKYDFKVKLNIVVQNGINDNEIDQFIDLTKKDPIEVRFIEQMPFDGKSEKIFQNRFFNIISEIKNHFEISEVKNSPFSTSTTYSIKNYRGQIGFIPAYQRTFCSNCNRLRVTPTGILKTCLYDSGALNLKTVLESENNHTKIVEKIVKTVQNRALNGKIAEKNASSLIKLSMSSIGG